MIARTELRGAIRRGVAWKAGALGANQLLRLATLVIVARALSPREFGLAAIYVSAQPSGRQSKRMRAG